MRPPRIQVLLDDTELTPDVRIALERIHADVSLAPLSALNESSAEGTSQARLVLTRDAKSLTNGKLEAFLAGFDRVPCTTLVLSQTPLDPVHQPEHHTQDRPIRFSAELTADQLVERLTAMFGFSGAYEKLRQELEDLKRRDEGLMENLKRFEEELRLAGLIQRDLFRVVPPVVSGASIHTLFRPAADVSGDVYHVTRLDESHVAIAVADATGHGLAAGMLSVFIQRSWSTSKQRAQAEDAYLPGAMLSRLNREILDAELNECHFVTATYAVYNEETRVMCWARGGAPYPLLLRVGQSPRPVLSQGPLLGVDRNALFESVTFRLHPGDTLVFHTDGLDEPNHKGDPKSKDARRIPNWASRLGSRPIRDELSDLELRLTTEMTPSKSADDVTVLAVEVLATPSTPRPLRAKPAECCV